ncbi:MAG: B12-binding domain-containing radical SAM protein [Candidatus Omnitrophica bacterium]|nr:B12-binding domain-containing radical SAM protein [Candidatus Omnitrophota bacterium]
MFSIGIIVPTWHYFKNPFKLQPLNELYFATVIDDRFAGKGVTVSVIDLRQLRNRDGQVEREKIASYIAEHDLYLYWIAKSADYFEIVDVVNAIRNIYKKAKHAAGGTHIDNFLPECAESFDALVTGPGEESFITIINDCRKGELKKIYTSDWQSSDFNKYPFPRRHYLPESTIVNTVLFEKFDGIAGTSAMFSRGCNFQCAYCVYNTPPMVHMRKPELIESEIAYLKDTYAVKGINLRDEICIPVKPEVATPYVRALGRQQVLWRGQTRIGASKEILELAHDAGCVELAVGVESASQEVLDIIHKGQTVQQARSFIDTCKSVGIKVKMCLILGLPGEPLNIVESTRKFIDEVQPDYVNISGFCPMPGSAIFKNSTQYGIKYIDNDWRKHAHLLYRFSDEEHFGLPFEYEETTRWGKAFSRADIINNIKELQHYLQEHQMVY